MPCRKMNAQVYINYRDFVIHRERERKKEMKYLAEYQYVISMNINDIPVQFYRRYSCHLYTAFLSDFQVNWNDEGFATFHEVCWHTLIKRLSKDKASGITKAEGDMIKEALKTAEIHDSYEKLKKEAEHVAHLIKNSEYCIAFTGIYICMLYSILHFMDLLTTIYIHRYINAIASLYFFQTLTLFFKMSCIITNQYQHYTNAE